MERTEILDLMGKLKLAGMKAAFDEVIANGIKRRHEPQRLIGDLLKAELADEAARSIKYQLAIAKLPLAKELADFQFNGTPINEALVRDLAAGSYIAQQRNIVLAGGTGSGKTHLGIVRQSAALPRDQPPLRENLNHRQHQISSSANGRTSSATPK